VTANRQSRYSASTRQRHHQRKLFSPERAAVRPDPLGHHDIRTCIAQRIRPPGRVLEEERLLSPVPSKRRAMRRSCSDRSTRARSRTAASAARFPSVRRGLARAWVIGPMLAAPSNDRARDPTPATTCQFSFKPIGSQSRSRSVRRAWATKRWSWTHELRARKPEARADGRRETQSCSSASAQAMRSL
jgi:hypothetical protein